MDTPTAEISEQSTVPPSNVTDKNCNDNPVPDEIPNHGVEETKNEIAEGEVRSILEVIAHTGKFWHDWEKLRSMLSFHLKQVLFEYPEAKMTLDQQNSTLGETYSELVKRLDDALHAFVEGPPFTLQRLSEILLDARSMYPNLSKLALALEKNLLVTSTLTISTDPSTPVIATPPDKADTGTEDLQVQPDPVQNGIGMEPIMADKDDIMTEVEADAGDDMTMDVENFEVIVGTSETSSETGSIPAVNS